MKRNVIFFISILFFCLGCQFKFSPSEEQNNHTFQIKRYDRLEYRYLTTGDFSALQQMNTEYPIESRTLIANVLKIGEATDPNINTTFLNYYQDTVLQTILADAEAKYANMDTLNHQLGMAFAKLKKFLPNIQIPLVYAQISALNQSIIVGNQSVGISLDKYLGTNYALYKHFDYTEAQRKQMTKEYIIPDVLSYYLMSLYPMKGFETCPQNDRDLHVGRIQWVVNQALGCHFFKNKFVENVDNFMRRNPQITYVQLLRSDNISNSK